MFVCVQQELRTRLSLRAQTPITEAAIDPNACGAFLCLTSSLYCYASTFILPLNIS